MSSIVVFRYLGDKRGEDITEALLASNAAKVERGRVEMDLHALPNQTVTMQIVYRPGVRLGQIVEVNDSTQGASWRGKITGIVHKITKTKHVTDLTLSRPTEDF